MLTAIMVATLLLVCGAMFGVLTWFFRRLRRIEEAVYGPQGHTSFRDQVVGAWGRLKAYLRRQP